MARTFELPCKPLPITSGKIYYGSKVLVGFLVSAGGNPDCVALFVNKALWFFIILDLLEEPTTDRENPNRKNSKLERSYLGHNM